MALTGIFIDGAVFRSWPEALQDEVIQRTLGGRKLTDAAPVAVGEDAAASSAAAAEDEHLAQLSPTQAREFLDGCGPKTRTAIVIMVSNDTRFFNLKDVAAALNVPAAKLVGVWSGLTRRTRTVTGDKVAELIFWHGEGEYDGDDYIDHLGELTESTYAAFRKALRIS